MLLLSMRLLPSETWLTVALSLMLHESHSQSCGPQVQWGPQNFRCPTETFDFCAANNETSFWWDCGGPDAGGANDDGAQDCPGNTGAGGCVNMFCGCCCRVSPSPTGTPTDTPSSLTEMPTGYPTTPAPSHPPTTSEPTTAAPTEIPTTTNPTTLIPTDAPTEIPTDAPTDAPTAALTDVTTTTEPTTFIPTGVPTEVPTDLTTEAPLQSTNNIQGSNNGEEDTGNNLGFLVAGGMGAVILVMAMLTIRQRAHRQPQPTVQQSIPPVRVNNPVFKPEYAALNYAEVAVGNVMPPQAPQYEIPVAHNQQNIDPAMPPQAPQYDTVGFVRDQYAALGPHSTYNSVDTEA